MSAMAASPTPEISPAELRAYVLMQVQRLEAAVAPIRHTRADTLVDEVDPARQRAALETRVATLEERFALGGR